jgi:tetratricopeptide (TPR) repeat protein
MSQTSTSRLSPTVHLQRAFGFIKEVQDATQDLRRRAIDHDAQVKDNKPFLEGMISSIKGSRDLSKKKAELCSDLQLADQELDRALSLDTSVELETEDGKLSIVQLRSWIIFMTGQIEMAWGHPDRAIQLFSSCIQMWEFADPHYMLGIVYESKYMPGPALQHFERCLELDPSGELSISAIREANAMRNYKKRFRGNWSTFFLLLLIWPAAIIYFVVKRK